MNSGECDVWSASEAKTPCFKTPVRGSRRRSTAPTSEPSWAEEILNGLPSFNTANCSSGLVAKIELNAATHPAFLDRFGRFKETAKFTAEERAVKADELLGRLKRYALGERSRTAAAPKPVCKQQSKIESIYGNGEKTQYQHTFEQTGR